jgi:hypothetical protein
MKSLHYWAYATWVLIFMATLVLASPVFVVLFIEACIANIFRKAHDKRDTVENNPARGWASAHPEGSQSREDNLH